MTKDEMTALLSGFEQRMKFFQIVRSLTVVSCPDEIREVFTGSDGLDMLTNLLLMTVLFIEERTLSEDEKCTLSDISSFIENAEGILPDQYRGVPADSLAEFFVVNVLQNSGKVIEYPVYDSGKGEFSTAVLRLVNEEKGAYSLTDDVFDFLFRSKEIESELDYSVTRFKMQEYMRRQNYTEALGQSRDLVQQIRNMKRNLNDFLIRCRENITRISPDDYQGLIHRFRSLMEDEYQQLTQLERTVDKELDRFRELWEQGGETEEARKNLLSVQEIRKNLSRTMSEQLSLINRKDLVSDSYERMLRDSFALQDYERLNFEKDIMMPLRQADGDRLMDAYGALFYSLGKPAFRRFFNIESFYRPVDRLSEDGTEDGLDLSETEDGQDAEIVEKNALYREIGRAFFSFLGAHRAFSVSEFITSQTMDSLIRWTRFRLLPHMLLAMYQKQEIDLQAVRNDSAFFDAVDPQGEFNLLWIILESKDVIPDGVRTVRFYGSDRNCRYTVGAGEETEVLELTDFRVEAES